MNNQWIEHKGGECPVEAHTELELKFGDGITRGPVKAGNAAWSSGLPEKYSIVAYREYNCPPDPHKEWVKIQEGCVMPEEGVEVIAITASKDCHYCYIDNENDNRALGVFDTDYGFSFTATHWRYPHPDPIED